VLGPASRPGSRSATTTRARSGPTGSRTRSPRASATARRAIVVDFGTSTNFDVVSAAGEYVGGVLAPGIEISMDALFARAARLRRSTSSSRRAVIGKTTVAALQSGLVYGFAGQVDAIVERIRAELGAEAPVVATGGLADLIAPHASHDRPRRPGADARGGCGSSGSAAGDRSRGPARGAGARRRRTRGDSQPARAAARDPGGHHRGDRRARWPDLRRRRGGRVDRRGRRAHGNR
jgi:hypothetical protein